MAAGYPPGYWRCERPLFTHQQSNSESQAHREAAAFGVTNVTDTNRTYADREAFFAQIDTIAQASANGVDSMIDLGKAVFTASREGLAAEIAPEGNPQGSFARQVYVDYAKRQNDKSRFGRKIDVDNADSLKAQVAKLNVFTRAGATPDLPIDIVDRVCSHLATTGTKGAVLASSYASVVDCLRKAMASKEGAASFAPEAVLDERAAKLEAKKALREAIDEVRDVAALLKDAKAFALDTKYSDEARAMFTRIASAIANETNNAAAIKAARVADEAAAAAGVGNQELVPANSPKAPKGKAQPQLQAAE